MQQDETRFINENEVSVITGLSVQTLRNWRFQGKGISYIKAGSRAVRYKLDDVLSFMEERKITPRESASGVAQ